MFFKEEIQMLEKTYKENDPEKFKYQFKEKVKMLAISFFNKSIEEEFL